MRALLTGAGNMGRAIRATLTERGDTVVAMVGRPTLEYYAERQGWLDRLGSFSTFPPVGDENPAAVFPTPLDSVDTYRSQARAIRAAWERTGVSTVWCEGVLLNLEPGFPSMATVPPPDGRFIDANALGYPGSILVYTLLGLEPAPVSARFRRDWMGADRVLLAIPRTRWIPVDSLPPVEATTP